MVQRCWQEMGHALHQCQHERLEDAPLHSDVETGLIWIGAIGRTDLQVVQSAAAPFVG